MAKVIGYDKSVLTQYKKTCKKCGAIIVFKEEDVVEADYSEQGVKCRKVYGICPNCSSIVDIDLEKDKYVEQTPENPFSGWPTFTNCSRNCKYCYAKCLWRKEPTITNSSDC